MKLVVAGSRGFDNLGLLSESVSDFHWEIMQGEPRMDLVFKEVVSGGARGADQLGEQYAAMHNIPVTKMIPDWDGLGKRAGMVRNAEMAEYADAVIVFWDGESKGTKQMIDCTKRKGKYLKVVLYNEEG